MARQWGRAGALADQARAVLCRAGIEESYAAPLVCAVQARAAMHRRDVAAARQELVRAQRLRSLLTYAIPQLAIQARLELTRVHLALADVAGARALVLEVNELLRRRPGMGTLVGEAEVLRDQLSNERDVNHPGVSSLTGAELRVLPLLATHLSFPQIADQLFLSPHTVKSQAMSIYPEAVGILTQPGVAYFRELGLLGCDAYDLEPLDLASSQVGRTGARRALIPRRGSGDRGERPMSFGHQIQETGRSWPPSAGPSPRPGRGGPARGLSLPRMGQSRRESADASRGWAKAADLLGGVKFLGAEVGEPRRGRTRPGMAAAEHGP